MSHFINPFTDMGFKRIFGQEFSKPLLLDFLNNLLAGERKIDDITLLDKEQLPATADGRNAIYDILCKTDSGEYIIVEMQNNRQPYFKQRSVYYAANAIARQATKGDEWRYDIKAVYLVAFLNFTLPDIGGSFRTDVSLMDVRTKTEFTDMLRLIYLQLPLFTKDAEECETDFERWIYVLKNMETINRLPWMAKSAVFKRLSELAEVGALNREERLQYDHALKQYRDNLNVYLGAIEEGEAKGFVKGEAKGLAKGEAKAKHEVAQRMKAYGLSLDEIVQLSGLSAEEVAGLA